MATTDTKTSAQVALYGVGRMGQAMAAGWLAGMDAAGLSDVLLIEPFVTPAVEALSEKPGAQLNPAQARPVDVLVLAVKPQKFAEAAGEAAKWVGPDTIVVSVMAGISIAQLSRTFGPKARVVRTMPNTPGAVGAGVTAFSLSEACKTSDADIVSRLLAPLGAVEGPIGEDMMDAVTAVSGSGPAYIFFMVEAMAAAGRKLGLPEDMAERLAQQTVVGAGVLLGQEGARASDLRKGVTSPNGTTQAALDVLMSDEGLPLLMRNALGAAARRSADLSRES